MDRTDRLTVGNAMTTDLHTVGPDARLDLAALVMDRRCIRQLIVLDEDDRLLGLVSYRPLLQLLVAHRAGELESGLAVREYMEPAPVTVTADTPLREAIWVMLDREVSVVPVVDHGRVVGILSEHDVVRVAGDRMERPDRKGPTP